MQQEEPETQLQTLDGSHNRAAFDCGVESLNRWLRESASQQEKNSTARTFVATPTNVDAWRAAGFKDVTESTILGYFALSSGQVEGDSSLPRADQKRLPRSVPIARLGRLAVDRAYKGQGLGQTLLMEAIHRSLAAAESIGIAGIFVDAKEGVGPFYEKYGFVACEDDPTKLWMPLKALRDLVRD